MNARQATFVREYLVDLNATQAAIRAGYSKRTAEQLGSRLLRNVQVAAAVKTALEARAERVEVKADDVLRELLRLARVDLADAFEKDGKTLKNIHDMPEDLRRAISGHKPTEWGIDIKFHPKTTALELLGKHLGLFKDAAAAVGHSELTVVVQSLASPPKRKK